MPTVYQTHQTPNIDVRPALAYGDLRVLVDQRGEPALAPVPLVNRLRHELRNFSDEDYLLPTGSPAVIAAAAMVAAGYNRGRVRVLLWDRREHKYFETIIEV